MKTDLFRPIKGDSILGLTLNPDGTLDVSRPSLVRDPHFSSHEFTTTNHRHSLENLHPNSSGFGGVAPLSHFPISMHLYCVERDLEAAKTALQASWLSAHVDALKKADALSAAIREAIEKNQEA